MKKTGYITPEVGFGYVLSGSILIGSKTDEVVEVNKVEVEDFDKGFDNGDGTDFKELSFD